MCQKERLAEKASPLDGVILLIEDDLNDIEVISLALAKSAIPCQLISVQFARDAIKYLGRIGEYADESRFPWPALILLDLSLPGMSGFDFLAWAKCEPSIPPIAVLSYSALEADRILAQKFGVLGYFVKTPNLDETVEMLRRLPSLPQNPG